jgi:hypothetical protein
MGGSYVGNAVMVLEQLLWYCSAAILRRVLPFHYSQIWAFAQLNYKCLTSIDGCLIICS